jgi:RNA polymerase sigma-70 factor (ECF subfamily)
MIDKRRRFEAEVLPHLDAAYRFARWLCRSPGDADDVVQDAILRAYRAFETMRGTDPKAWLFTIVRNCHLTAAKQARRRGFVPLPEEGDAKDGHAMIASAPDPETATINRDDKLTLDRLVAALPEQHREVLVLREIEEMDYREIAKVTNVPIGTVMSRLARARAALRLQWHLDTREDAHAVP